MIGINAYAPRGAFLDFHNRAERWAVLVCHRRAGKTVACVAELVLSALATAKRDALYAYVAPQYNQAKDIAWRYIKRLTQDIPGVAYNESELRADLPNGSRIRLYGADNPDRLRGLYLDGVVLDEYADMRPSVWGEIVRPMLADRKGWAIFIGTPKGHNAFFDVWQQAEHKPGWWRLMLKASASGLLDAEELEDARRAMSDDQFEQEFECSFEAAITGAVYGRQLAQLSEAGRLREGLYDPKLPVFTAWDLGMSDATAIWFWQQAPGEIRLVDYYEASNQPLGHYIGVLRSKPYTMTEHYVPHDAAHELLAAGGKSIAEQLWKEGIKAQVVSATGQANSIEAARLMLGITWIDPTRCAQGLEALRQYQFKYDEDRRMFADKPRHDWASHASDAFEIVAQVYRKRIGAEPKPAPRFLNDMTANELFWPAESGHSRESDGY